MWILKLHFLGARPVRELVDSNLNNLDRCVSDPSNSEIVYLNERWSDCRHYSPSCSKSNTMQIGWTSLFQYSYLHLAAHKLIFLFNNQETQTREGIYATNHGTQRERQQASNRCRRRSKPAERLAG